MNTRAAVVTIPGSRNTVLGVIAGTTANVRDRDRMVFDSP